MSRPFPSRQFSANAGPRVNGKIRAREVRVIGVEGNQLGVLSLSDALTKARNLGVDLVEIAPTAVPPVCRLVDFGKFRYEQAKKDKDSKKHQHANKVKEIQLSAKIDPHDLGVKLSHAIDFLCEDMKVKIALRFRGREMQHTEFGFQVVEKFLKEIAPYGHPDFAAKLIGRSINVMISPLPRNKRAKNPRQSDEDNGAPEESDPSDETSSAHSSEVSGKVAIKRPASSPSPDSTSQPDPGFANNPFAQIDIK